MLWPWPPSIPAIAVSLGRRARHPFTPCLRSTSPPSRSMDASSSRGSRANPSRHRRWCTALPWLLLAPRTNQPANRAAAANGLPLSPRRRVSHQPGPKLCIHMILMLASAVSHSHAD